MSETWNPEIVVGQRVEMLVHLVGIAAVAGAAYHTGQTGNWMPLLGLSMLLALVVLFVTSE